MALSLNPYAAPFHITSSPHAVVGGTSLRESDPVSFSTADLAFSLCVLKAGAFWRKQVKLCSRLNQQTAVASLVGCGAKVFTLIGVMPQVVIALISEQFKVVYRIVKFVSVLVVNHLRCFQCTPDVNLHNVSVLKNSFGINHDPAVSTMDRTTLESVVITSSKREATARFRAESLSTIFAWSASRCVRVAALLASLLFPAKIIVQSGVYSNETMRNGGDLSHS